MGKTLALVGATIGGSIGWWLGAQIGLVTAFLVSTVGSGAGIYAAKRFADHFVG